MGTEKEKGRRRSAFLKLLNLYLMFDNEYKNSTQLVQQPVGLIGQQVVAHYEKTQLLRFNTQAHKLTYSTP